MRAHRLWFAAAVILFATAAARDGIDRWVTSTHLPPLIPEVSTEVLDADGHLLRAYQVDGRWRLKVSQATVDPAFVSMLLAYEDRRFFSHSGVDGRALLRAAVQSAQTGRIVSGGSTLTMQVARLLERGSTGRWAGKLRQIRVAWALEHRLSKRQILNLYLHLAPYGGNIEGVRAASLIWFGKPPARLTPAEAALLVALPQSPETRRPDRHLRAARDARSTVLQRATRFAGLSQEEAAAATQEALPHAQTPMPQYAPHLADRLRAAAPHQTALPTTINGAMQQQLETLAGTALNDLGPKMALAIVVMDHTTGAGRASVGSGRYSNGPHQGFVDMTRALRSPGSTLKPFVYALGFDAGLIHPNTLIDDQPIRFGTYAPQNFDSRYRGTVRVRDALHQSLNIPVVMVLDEIGPVNLMSALRRTGAQPRIPGGAPGLAIGLGGLGISLEDLVQAYGTFPNRGHSVALHWQAGAPPKGQRVLSDVAAWQIGDILAQTPRPTHARHSGIAFKTGTSYGHRDAWAIGFDGQHVVGVWIGRADGTPVPGAFGGDTAAPVMFEVFSRLAPTATRLPAPPSSTLIVATDALPEPLQRFRPRGAAFSDADPLSIVFPPNGAVVELIPDLPIFPRVENGVPPFVWFLDGTPIATAQFQPSVELRQPQPGFAHLSVIDANGLSAQSEIEFRPATLP